MVTLRPGYDPEGNSLGYVAERDDAETEPWPTYDREEPAPARTRPQPDYDPTADEGALLLKARSRAEVKEPEIVGVRRVTLTPASAIKPRPVRWLWEDRIALGTLNLVGGREGIGKSMVCYWMASQITRGKLPGVYQSIPKSVIVAATEDSWEHTIVPRLMAADADLDKVFRVDVVTSDDFDTELSLPRDITALRCHVAEVDAAMVLLDPLISRLDSHLDSHKDAEVRRALEPLTKLAVEAGVAVPGIIHVNKSTGGDALSSLMASRAFPAVARSVLYVVVDPENEHVRFMGQPKNNLGRTDLPTLTFTIGNAMVAETDEGEVWTGRINWGDDTTVSIEDALRASGESPEARTLTQEAGEWLLDLLSVEGQQVMSSKEIRDAAKEAGHSPDALKRARRKVSVGSSSHGFPRCTYWSHPKMSPDEVKAWLDRLPQVTPSEGNPQGRVL